MAEAGVDQGVEEVDREIDDDDRARQQNDQVLHHDQVDALLPLRTRPVHDRLHERLAKSLTEKVVGTADAKVRHVLVHAHQEHPPDNAFARDGEQDTIPVTASFGVVNAAQGELRGMLDAADAALYRAKDGGRDRVAVASWADLEREEIARRAAG